ncbi:helix-turn-helix domain-containing protein [Winogradskyella wichelsiae]|uniref:helix-turn-helix domain-containing protein n=1 Tax=Winogradskyella wichelsiae TaxID=2697007 RepID=UPI0015CEBCAE|nr:AraC family transcriptional regulator [Winogradskyella wichelsiae]
MQTLHIKNMVCNRCITAVHNILDEHHLKVTSIELGEVILNDTLSNPAKIQLGVSLNRLGFELIDSKKSQIIEKIKNSIIQLVHYKNSQLDVNLSDYLVTALHQDYSALSNLFSEVEGITIEKYFIAQKIEKVKELLVYDELSLSEIAFQLHYSSVAYLSSQFKKVTGLTPSHFKKIGNEKRKPLDQL